MPVADRLVEPIRRLITAADSVAAGNLETSVPISRSEGELRSLADTFNLMTSELRNQRDEILDNQEQIGQPSPLHGSCVVGRDSRRHWGIREGRLVITNSSAAELLGRIQIRCLAALWTKSVRNWPTLSITLRPAADNLFASRLRSATAGRDRILNVQVSVDHDADGAKSNVITIDDITDLVSAQRTSAWADVARRIAHEIKNPLTPIQLSAERIRRRYGKVITEDREVFDQCTDTHCPSGC